MIWPTIAILIALAIAALITIPAAPPPRHHLYYCMEPTTGFAMQCKWRRNDPISV
jgi:hypothetical protein